MAVLLGCLHGTCIKPFQCQCMPGWQGLMCDQHLDLAMRRHLGYGARCSTMSDRIFPGVFTDVAGLSSTAGLVATNLVCHPGVRCSWIIDFFATWMARR